MHHARAERRPLHVPFAARIPRPDEILHRDAVNALLAQPEGLDPAGESAFDGGVRDVVVDAHAARVGIVEHFAQADDGGAGVGHAGVRVVDRHHAMAGIEGGERRGAAAEVVELRREGAGRIVLEAVPAVIMDAQAGQQADEFLHARSRGIDDAGGHHGHFKAAFSQQRDERRQIGGRCAGLDVAALANRDVHAIEAGLQRRGGQRFAAQELQMLREDGDLPLPGGLRVQRGGGGRAQPLPSGPTHGGPPQKNVPMCPSKH